MRIAISVPNDVFSAGERMAQRLGWSRSELYSAAIREYLARHDPDSVTRAMNQALKTIPQKVDPMVRAAARRTLMRTEW